MAGLRSFYYEGDIVRQLRVTSRDHRLLDQWHTEGEIVALNIEAVITCLWGAMIFLKR